MNDQKIYTLIALRPHIRASELANELNTPMIDVSASLRALVDVGDLVRHTKFDDDTGRQYQAYELSDAFKATRDGKALLAKLSGEELLESPQATTPAPTPTPTAFSMPMATCSKVDRAIAFIREHGKATDGELKTVMDLSKSAAPQAYLQTAIKNGKVRRDGVYWKIGLGPTHPTAQAADNFATVGNIIVATRNQESIPTPVMRSIEAAIPAPDAVVRRCGIFSDGMVELQRDGRLQAQLYREDAEFLADFILGLRKTAAA